MLSFTSNCTSPPEGTNFVAAPPIRGTLEILWSSLSVLVLCTWSIVHLNVPPQTKAKGIIPRTLRDLRRFYTKVSYLLFNLLAPEWILAKSFMDWKSARDVHRNLSYIAKSPPNPVPWSVTHTHYANQGGIGISFGHLPEPVLKNGSINIQNAEQKPGEKSLPSVDPENTGANTHQSFNWLKWLTDISKAILGEESDNLGENMLKDLLDWSEKVLSDENARKQDWQIDNTNSELLKSIEPHQIKDIFSQDDYAHLIFPNICANLLLLKANCWILNAAQLLKARELGIITSLPKISEDDLYDRDKSSYFIKLIALGQTGWFMLQFLVRVCTKQTTTQLEVMVFAFTISSIATYFFAWNRLKDVTYTNVSEAARRPKTGTELVEIAARGPVYSPVNSRSTIWISNDQITSASVIEGVHDFDNFANLAFLVVITFGALQCIAWNYVFPTKIDQIVWRVCSLATAAIFPLCSTGCNLLHWLVERFSCVGSKKLMGTTRTIWGVSLVCFIVARLFILVEVFRCLGFQPPGAFQATWTKDIPNIG